MRVRKKDGKKLMRWNVKKKRAFILITTLFLFFIFLWRREIFDLGNYPKLRTKNRLDRCNDLDQLSPATKKLCEKFLERCEDEGLPVVVTETYRTQERQDMLYEQGRTQPGAVVTWTKKSQHTSHRAFDIMKNVRGEEYSDEYFFRRCAEIGKEVGLNSGYYWEVRDACHFQFDPWWRKLLGFFQ